MRIRTWRLPRHARRLPLLIVGVVVAALGSAPLASGVAVEDDPAVHCDQPGVDDKCEAWVFAYDNPRGHGTGFGWDIIDVGAMAVSPTGDRVYLTGTSAEGLRPEDPVGCKHQHVVTVAVDQASGEQAWEAHYGAIPFSYSNDARAAVSPNGERVFILNNNRSQVCGRTTELKLVAYEADTGRQLWDTTDLAVGGPIGAVGAGSLDVGQVVVSPDGQRVYATARAFPRGLVLAFDAATGERLWTSTSQDSQSPILAVSPDGGRVYYVDSEWDDNKKQYVQVVRAYDVETSAVAGTPAFLWEAEESDPGKDVLVAGVGINSDGSRLVVSGRIDWTAYVTVVDTATGATLWTARYGGPNVGVGASQLGSAAFSSDGQRVYGTGWTEIQRDDDESRTRLVYLTAAYHAETGQSVWARTETLSTLSDAAFALVVSPDNDHLFVTGGSAQAIRYNAANDVGAQTATVAYDTATGKRGWVAQFRPDNGVTNGFTAGWDLGISPDGARVFVNGMFRNDWNVGLDLGLGFGGVDTDVGPFTCREVNCSDIGLLAYDTGTGAPPADSVMGNTVSSSSAASAVNGVGR